MFLRVRLEDWMGRGWMTSPGGPCMMGEEEQEPGLSEATPEKQTLISDNLESILAAALTGGPGRPGWPVSPFGPVGPWEEGEAEKTRPVNKVPKHNCSPPEPLKKATLTTAIPTVQFPCGLQEDKVAQEA